jgi:flagellar biosynthetic protein FliQ
MTESDAMHILGRAVLVATEVLLPILLVALLIGIAVSLVQAATQVQEQTLTFVPKLAGVVLVMLIMGPWMIRQLNDFTREMYDMIPTLVR